MDPEFERETSAYNRDLRQVETRVSDVEGSISVNDFANKFYMPHTSDSMESRTSVNRSMPIMFPVTEADDEQTNLNSMREVNLSAAFKKPQQHSLLNDS